MFTQKRVIGIGCLVEKVDIEDVKIIATLNGHNLSPPRGWVVERGYLYCFTCNLFLYPFSITARDWNGKAASWDLPCGERR